MFLAALVDAGVPLDFLKAQLQCLNVPDLLDVRAYQVYKGALRAIKVDVCVGDDDHEHEHEGDHDDDHHDHHHRRWADIVELIDKSGLGANVKSKSQAIFECLAQAEAAVHGTTPEEVHFHEVGAVDSIVDIVGAAIGLDYLEIEQLYASPLPLGTGQVETQHGLMPLPAPATLELIRKSAAPVLPSPARSELVTPTGAAILAALAQFEQPIMAVGQVGVGAGSRDLPWPNIMRVIVGAA
jgi:uncharacterized protein (TIGR00299 family) protein